MTIYMSLIAEEEETAIRHTGWELMKMCEEVPVAVVQRIEG